MYNETPRPRNKTNAEIVADFMEGGSPMNQAFVMEAISLYATQVKEKAADIRANMKDSFINPDAWIACAHDWSNAQNATRQPITRFTK